jgi:hypothetical protein
LFGIALQPFPQSFVGLGVLELQRALLIGRDHRHAGMHGAQNLRVRLRIDPVREPGEPLVQCGPECNAVSRRRRGRDGAQAGDMLVADLAIMASGLDEAGLQSARGLTEADEHGAVA